MNRLSIVLAPLLAVACHRPDDGAPPPAPEHAAEHADHAKLDTRKPVPLNAMMASHMKQEMRGHLVVIQEIVTGLAHDDFAAIEKAAARIGWNEQEAVMCKHMGAEAPGFAEMGEQFHHTADTIVDAARRRDHKGVVDALGATLQTCTGCHAAFRQEVVGMIDPP